MILVLKRAKFLKFYFIPTLTLPLSVQIFELLKIKKIQLKLFSMQFINACN